MAHVAESVLAPQLARTSTCGDSVGSLVTTLLVTTLIKSTKATITGTAKLAAVTQSP